MGRIRAAPTSAAELRGLAEARFKKRSAKRKALDAGQDPRRVLHELEVHQIELEIQNEELLRARTEVEAGLARYTQIFDFAPIGYFVLAGDGTVRKLNFAGGRLLGEDRRGLVGKRLALWIVEPDRRAFSDFLARVIAGDPDESRSCELSLVRAPSPIQVRLTGGVLAGAPPAALLAVEDVSPQRLAEGVLRDEARRKDDFLAALSHELRNPLAALSHSLYVLERAAAGSEPEREARAILRRQLTHLGGLVDDLLDVTRVARGKIVLRLEPLELEELVRGTVDDYRPSFDANGVALTLCPSGGELWVTADRTRVVQVLGNLLGNAMKFTSRGGNVEVRLTRSGETTALSVRDDGAGIATDVLPHLFTPFTQAPQTIERARGGLGLGLAVVKGLVELHRGTVEGVSRGPGAGSTFTITLPLARPPAVAARAREPEATERPRRPCRVLLIDDNRDVARALQDVLGFDGHEVHVAPDGPSGVALAHELRPDVVLCDIGLPGMDGYEVAQAIRKDPALERTVLVALSGYGLPEDVQRALDAGFDEHVAKPPTLQTLERVIARVR